MMRGRVALTLCMMLCLSGWALGCGGSNEAQLDTAKQYLAAISKMTPKAKVEGGLAACWKKRTTTAEYRHARRCAGLLFRRLGRNYELVGNELARVGDGDSGGCAQTMKRVSNQFMAAGSFMESMPIDVSTQSEVNAARKKAKNLGPYMARILSSINLIEAACT